MSAPSDAAPSGVARRVAMRWWLGHGGDPAVAAELTLYVDVEPVEMPGPASARVCLGCGTGVLSAGAAQVFGGREVDPNAPMRSPAGPWELLRAPLASDRLDLAHAITVHHSPWRCASFKAGPDSFVGREP